MRNLTHSDPPMLLLLLSSAPGPRRVHLQASAWWPGREHGAAGGQRRDPGGQRHRRGGEVSGSGERREDMMPLYWAQTQTQVQDGRRQADHTCTYPDILLIN